MKLISNATGVIAVRYQPEDVMPTPRLSRPDAWKELVDRHHFLGRGDPNATPIVLQNGSATIDGTDYAFNELLIFNGEISCQAQDTELAERIAQDLFQHFDKKFGYKFAGSMLRMAFVSNIIVEFDQEFDNVISTTHLLEKLINTACPGQRNLKRLSFGLRENASGSGQPATPYDAACCAEFFVERRLGSDPHQNRFFCSAPLRTPQHIQVLGELEKVTAGQKKLARS